MSVTILASATSTQTLTSPNLQILPEGNSITSTGDGIVLQGTLSDLVVRGSVAGLVGVEVDSFAGGRSIINVGATGTVDGANRGIQSDRFATQIIVSGQVTSGGVNGIEIVTPASGSSSFESVISISATGEVSAVENGLFLGQDDMFVSNAGRIVAGEGISVDADGSRIVNTGEIVGNGFANTAPDGAAIAAGFAMDVVNSGVLMGASPSRVVLSTSPTAEDRLDNTGLISGGIDLDGGNDTVVNGGTIAGDVDLGAGEDTYRGRGDGSVAGVIRGEGGQDTLIGSDADDVIAGGADFDTIRGRGGDDSLLAGTDSSGDNLFGGAGDDTIAAADGDAQIYAGAGEDLVDGGAGDDTIYGGADADDMTGLGGDDLVLGNTGDDFLTGGTGNDTVQGGQGDDTVRGGGWSDTVFGGAGEDSVDGGDGADLVGGGSGGDTVAGGDGDDRIFGGTGDDDIIGQTGDDEINAGAGADTVAGNNQDDTIRGQGGDDSLDGGSGQDTIRGGEGHDTIEGGIFGDLLGGGAGNDLIDGEGGNDTIHGGAGNDEITTGDGADDIVIRKGMGQDLVTDFTDGQDQVDVRALNLQNFGDLQSKYTVVAHQNAVFFDFGDGDTLMLDGVSLPQLAYGDFVWF